MGLLMRALMAHFLSNTGTLVDFPVGSQISNAVEATTAFQEANYDVQNVLLQNALLTNSPQNYTNLQLTLDETDLPIMGEGTALGFDFGQRHLQSLKLTAVGQVVNGHVTGTVYYQYVVEYGFGQNDVKNTGPTSANWLVRMLQLAGWAEPFPTTIEINMPIDFSIPFTMTNCNPCVLPITASYDYSCGGIDVVNNALASLSVPGANCTAPEVESALAQNFGGTSPPIQVAYNCNPAINTVLQNVAGALGAVADPPIDTTGAVTGTDEAANAAGASGNSSPVTLIETALGNLGLINGQSGNDGYATAQADQMVATIATFDQAESNLAGILATASGEGASLGITGDITLLQQLDSRLEAVTTAENLLFGGDANWLDTSQSATLQEWLTAFFTDVQSSTSGGAISTAETAQLLATTLPSSVSTSEAMEFIDRWNRTVQYWSEGIFTAAEVPAGQSTDFLDVSAIQSAFNAAVAAEQESEVDGYSDVGAEAQGRSSRLRATSRVKASARRSRWRWTRPRPSPARHSAAR